MRALLKRLTGIRYLLLGANAFGLLLPAIGIAGLRVYDLLLLRQTEENLLAQAVVVGEAFRDQWETHSSRTTPSEHLPPAAVAYRETTFPTATGYRSERVLAFLQDGKEADESIAWPFRIKTDLGSPVGPAAQPLSPQHPLPDDATSQAGLELAPLLKRSQTFNLSAVRVLNPAGCIVSSTGVDRGRCLSRENDVAEALRGNYSSELRQRDDVPSEDIGLSDLRRRGPIRVFVALPVFADGKVIAVVRASRTAPDLVRSLWENRRGFVLIAVVVALITTALSLGFSALIARPLRRLTRAAQEVSEGARASALDTHSLAPREIGALQTVLATMASRLEQRADYVQEFASHASHELRTPITAIRGAAELLESEWEHMPDADRRRFVQNIGVDAGRMQRLVTQLLELARAENQRQPHAAPINPVLFVRECVSRFGERVQVTEAAPGAPKEVTVSEEQLESVVTNLVDNALRYAEDGPVRVVLGTQGSQLSLEVSNQGAPISAANQKRLFERFFTTEREGGGTGLGLALVKAIAEARGGTVSARSEDGLTTFRVLL